ncbi:hypothetical protein FQR65_LT14100 [Abscondita terminalis]|nr:hypothetical protein FQR65_LT14100 [Abscondita terminalis]
MQDTAMNNSNACRQRNVNVIEINECESDVEEQNMFAGNVKVLNHAEQWNEECVLNDKLNFSFRLDTGADCSILSVELFNKLNVNQSEIKTSVGVISTLTDEVLRPLGTCTVKTQAKNNYSAKTALVDYQILNVTRLILDFIDLARDNGVILLRFPSHCSHRIQPLDVALMRPISLYYEEKVRMWMRSNPGKMMTLFQISTLFGAAFIQPCTMQTALNGFRKTSIWPPDKTVFTDDDFLPSATTNIQLLNLRGHSNESQRASDNSLILSNKNTCNLPQCYWMLDLTVESTSFPLGLKEAKEKRDIKEANKVALAKRKLSLGAEKNVINEKTKNTSKGKGFLKKKMCKSKRESDSSDTENEQDAHNSCANIDSDDDEAVFVCEICTI